MHQTPDQDVPVGAIIVYQGVIIGRGHNRREADGDPTAHAEILALREAAQNLGDGWRLADCTLVVTLEPCAMCAGAIMASKIKRVIFGAWEPKTGACGSVIDLIRDTPWAPSLEVYGGVLAEICSEPLTQFFHKQRGQEGQ